MTIYDDLAPLVSGIMSEFKQGTVTLVKIAPAAGPIDNPGNPTETSYTLDAAVSGVNFKYVRDGLAVASDLTVVAAPVAGVTVTEKDFLSIDNVRHKIVHDLSMPAAGTKIVWKFIARKGG